METFTITRIKGDIKETVEDVTAQEIPLTINLNAEELATILCSPESLKELSVGFLYSSGIIKSVKDLKNIIIDNHNKISYVELNNKNIDSKLSFKRLYTSGCGKGVIFYSALEQIHRKKIISNIKINSKRLAELMNSFQKMSVVFKKTGGVHSAALSDGDSILVFKEDIGRHNAVDKIIGEALINNLGLKDLIVLVSGRISSEIVSKIGKTKAAFLISRSAPTDQAISLAKRLNLTLVGFVRGRSMNVYAAAERVV